MCIYICTLQSSEGVTKRPYETVICLGQGAVQINKPVTVAIKHATHKMYAQQSFLIRGGAATFSSLLIRGRSLRLSISNY